MIPNRSGCAAILLFALSAPAASAQFKEIKAAPFTPAVARQKIHTLLENADATNRDQTVATLSDWLKWYRDLLDEELIARWKSDGRTNLPLLMTPLADARVAREVVDFSWRVDRADTFTLAYAAMLGDLMERYPESERPFLDDLLSQAALSLTPAEAQTVCRILLDMPDIGTWRKSAFAILPRYRSTVEQLLKQDLTSADQEIVYRAMRWRADLRLDPPPVITSHFDSRAASTTRPASGTRPSSGTFESTGEPIPENGEYVFRNIPPVKLILEFDTKKWEARLAPGEGQTQVLVLRNKSRSPQKKVVVHWTVAP